MNRVPNLHEIAYTKITTLFFKPKFMRNLFILALLLFGSSCQVFKYKYKHSSKKNYAADLEKNVFNFKYLSIKSNFQYEAQGTINKGVLDVRIQKDSMIWFSIRSGIGLEVFRVIIAPHEILAVDKLNRKAYQYDFKTLSEKLNFSLNFQMFQALLLGNPLHKDQAVVNVVELKDKRILTQVFKNLKVDNYINTDNNQLTDLILTDYSLKPNMRKMNIAYERFTLLDNQYFPIKYTVNLEDDKNNYQIRLKVEYHKVVNDQKGLRFPFKIPARYPILKH